MADITREQVLAYLKQLPIDELEKLLAEVPSIDVGYPNGVRLDSMPIPIYGAMSTVSYNDFDHDVFLVEAGPNRVLCLKEVRTLMGISLSESKLIIDTVPQRLETRVPIDEARQIRSRFESIGAQVEIHLTEDGSRRD
jgi:large subunit ribosomal protein L7/L12